MSLSAVPIRLTLSEMNPFFDGDHLKVHCVPRGELLALLRDRGNLSLA